MENENQIDVKSIIIVVLLALLVFCVGELIVTKIKLQHAEETIASWQQSGQNWLNHGKDPGTPQPENPQPGQQP